MEFTLSIKYLQLRLALDSIIKAGFDEAERKMGQWWTLKHDENNAIVVSNHQKISPRPWPKALF